MRIGIVGKFGFRRSRSGKIESVLGWARDNHCQVLTLSGSVPWHGSDDSKPEVRVCDSVENFVSQSEVILMCFPGDKKQNFRVGVFAAEVKRPLIPVGGGITVAQLFAILDKRLKRKLVGING